MNRWNLADALSTICTDVLQPGVTRAITLGEWLFASRTSQQNKQKEERMGPTKQQVADNGREPIVLPPKEAIVPVAPTPLSVLQDAVNRGANVETLAKLLELQERWEANQARKAFVAALAAFKLDLEEQEAYANVKAAEALLKMANETWEECCKRQMELNRSHRTAMAWMRQGGLIS